MLLRNDRQHQRAAFTLMEIIVVVAIILILAGAGALVLPRFLEDSKESRANLDVKTLEKAASAYYVKNFAYPQSIAILAERQQDGGAAYIDESLLKDPWGQDYIIDNGQTNQKTLMPLIYSPGPPGKNMQIRNWK
jgi:general secretion pathway protein G